MSLSLHALRLAGCLSAVASCALLLRRLLASRPRRLAERSCAACRPTLREHGGEPRKRCVRTAPPVAEAAAPLATAQADPSDARARARAHLRFGNLCARGGRPEKALSQYLAAARADPDRHSVVGYMPGDPRDVGAHLDFAAEAHLYARTPSADKPRRAAIQVREGGGLAWHGGVTPVYGPLSYTALKYTWYAPPTLSRIWPVTGPVGGATAVLIACAMIFAAVSGRSIR